MSGFQRKSLRRAPPGGWPLDGLFVGVATLRTTREMFLQGYPQALRAWDLSLWSGVTAQGSREALDRLHRAGLVDALLPDAPGHAPRFQFAMDYPLFKPLAALFTAERVMGQEISRAASYGLDVSHRGERGGSATPA